MSFDDHLLKHPREVKALQSTAPVFLRRCNRRTCLWAIGQYLWDSGGRSLGSQSYWLHRSSPTSTRSQLPFMFIMSGVPPLIKNHPQKSWNNEDRLSIPLDVSPPLEHIQLVLPSLPFGKVFFLSPCSYPPTK